MTTTVSLTGQIEDLALSEPSEGTPAMLVVALQVGQDVHQVLITGRAAQGWHASLSEGDTLEVLGTFRDGYLHATTVNRTAMAR